MALVPFNELMTAAERGQYAIGYFESWNLESLLAVADAAEAVRSPVILGFSGIYLSHPERSVEDPLSLYAAMGLDICRQLAVPACLLFNESPHFEVVLEAIELGFSLVMFTDENLSFEDQVTQVRQVVAKAHGAASTVEGEVTALAGVAGELAALPDDLRLTDPELAYSFVEQTGVDALAVNVGQAHLHGRQAIHLNLERLVALKKAVSVPLVLHGATSVHRADLVEAVRLGVRKINVGSILKRTYFEAMRQACVAAGEAYNPYEVIGSGLPNDVLTVGRLAMQQVVEELMRLFGSAGKI
jgi:ketose-bisphosphate aldolase